MSSAFLRKPTGEPMATFLNINKMTMGVRADGMLVPVKWCAVNYLYRWSAVYPYWTAGFLYKDGMIWGGKVYDGGELIIRVGGSDYRSGFLPGRIISKGMAENPDDPDVRIWRVRRDWQTVDLRRDAAEFLYVSEDSVTREQMEAIRSQYEKDWNEWPWEKGAPFYDVNGNGVMDNDEEPGLAYADQVVWFVANDLDPDVTDEFVCSPPIGLEMQVTLWAYNRTTGSSNSYVSRLCEALQNIIFKRVRIIYKGCRHTPDTARIDSMYIAQWSDPDLGDFADDLVGCDTLLDMGFVYNGKAFDSEYSRYDQFPPAAGYSIVSGSVVPSIGERASFNMGYKVDHKNLRLTSFVWLVPGPVTDNARTYETTLQYYKMIQGYQPLYGWPFYYYPSPPGTMPNAFPLAGDPVTGTGHVDGLGRLFSYPPGERYFVCNSGPFSMALGDTQEVIIALVGGLGADRLSSISVMKYNAKWARQLAQNHFEIGFPEEEESFSEPNNMPLDFVLYPNYPNPFNSETEICYDLPLARHVRLAVYNLLGQEVAVLVDEAQEPGRYAVRWDGTNVRGNAVPSGVYVYRLEAGHWVWTRKMTLLE